MEASPFGWGDELPALSGRKVDLRSLREDDAPALLDIFGNAEVTKFWSSPPLPDLAAARAAIADIHTLFTRRELFQWAVCTRDGGEVVGTCTLHHLESAHRRAEIGFALRRDMWGRGVASDAVTTLIGFSFDTLALHRLEADADPDNERSLRVLERQGFRREGYLRERWHHLGELRDGVLLGLLKREWTGGERTAPMTS